MRKWLALVLLLLPAIASAQITIPHTFDEGSTARSAQVNANFNTVATQALNRTGGHVTGELTVASGVLIDGVDISTMLTPTGATLPTLTVSGATTLASLTVTGGIQAGSGNVTIAGADGRIPEASLADGAILFRVAANELVTGSNRFSGFTTFGATAFPGSFAPNGTLAFVQSASAAPLQFWNTGAASNSRWAQVIYDGGFTVRYVDDGATSVVDPLTISRSGVTPPTIALNGAAVNIAGGALNLTHGAVNRISWPAVGAGPPSFGTRSDGAKLILYPTIGPLAADFAVGIASATLWFGVPTISNQFVWYGGQTTFATLSAGGLTLDGALSLPSSLNVGLGLGANTVGAGTTGLSNVRVTSNAGGTLDGINVGGMVEGRLVVVTNATAASVTINHESGSATSGYRIVGAGAAVMLQANTSLLFRYDASVGRWRYMGF